MFNQKKVDRENEISSNIENNFIRYLIKGVSRCFLFISIIQLLAALIERDMSSFNIFIGVIVSLFITLIAWFLKGREKE